MKQSKKYAAAAFRTFFGMEVGGRFILSALLLTLLCTATAFAQFTTARFNGIVTDNTGSAVLGASVTVEQVDTGYKQSVKTGASGDYLFPSLPVGQYQLTVEMNGFTTYVQKGITLTVGQSASQNVSLQVGAVSQQVTVQASANQVTTDDAAITQLVDSKSMQSLPMNGRQAQQLVFLVPGAVNVSNQNCGNDCEGGVLPGEQYAKVNGGGANGVYYLLDGVDYNDSYINTNLPFPSPDALQEFNVQTDNMSAAYGNATGGVANVVTKSGTDQIHGDVFEYLRNYAMDAKNYFATSPDPLKQNQFGGTIGGPVLKGRLFYFGSYQGTRQNTATNGEISQVPTQAERNGDFSDLLPTQLINPNKNSPWQFDSNNVIDPRAFDPTALFILKEIPLPNDPSGGVHQLLYNAAPSIQNTNEYLAKVDYILGKHHISGHYFQLHYDVPIMLPPASNILEGTPESPQSLGLKNVSVVDIYSISSNILLNSYFGWTSQTGLTQSAAPFTIAQAGSMIAQPTNFKPTLNVQVGGGNDFTVGDQTSTGSWNRGDVSDREILTLIRGTNEIQVGGEYRRIFAPMGNTYQADGNFDFDNNLSNNNLSDFMLGAVSSFTQAGGLYLDFTGNEWSFFGQDNWHATPRLTLSFGLRWDPFVPYTDSEGRVACFVPGAKSTRFPNAPVGLIFGGSNHDPGCPAASIYNSLGNVGPRFGFAYQLTQDGKTSVRGGAGYYYQSPNVVAFEDVVGVPPFAPIVNIQSTSLTDPYGYAHVANPFPGSFGPSNPGPSATFPQNISFTQIFDRNFRLPQILSYNLTLERGIGSSWLIRAQYVGNRASHLGGTGDQEAGLLQLNPARYTFEYGPPTEDNTQQRRVNPLYGFVNSINSGVNSNYNSGQIEAIKRIGYGLSFRTNFTWSHALNDYGPNGEPGGLATNTCACGRYFDYGPDAGDVSKVFRFSGDYAFPHAPIKGIGSQVINGWNLSTITSWQSGFPFTIFSGSDNSLSAIGADRADLTVPSISHAVLSTGRSHAALVNEWFDTNAFTQNAVDTYGDIGKNSMRGPRYFDTDLTLMKLGNITERVNYEFRAEFYNIFNNVNFENPDNGQQDGTFGQISSAQSPRILQMALKLKF
ncbi:TonB-dependent receptor [Paracidobacterium acidisoli]|uniref:TonB-dependent receptor n=1 Tax=Paracidobacterium acidisoli TaxID=2303751 RepID=A0A372IK15_9BACT|nr:TonB-dependent receptor [Paracidobacterium acidisoli]MBT9332608.1 TonB-dependent receptor [Paracidobacterium acidisoli]